jgi:hypothetical protein
MYVCMYVWMYMYVCMYVWMYVGMYVCMYVCIYLFMYLYLYILYIFSLDDFSGTHRVFCRVHALNAAMRLVSLFPASVFISASNSAAFCLCVTFVRV